MSGPLLSELIRENAFYVLGLPLQATRMEIEREGARWLAALELKLGGADRYSTPLGPQERTPDRVRRAMADLRDPNRRLVHEWTARLPADAVPTPVHASSTEPVQWQGVLAAYGFGRRRDR